ncbi:alkyl hydroperoxide reductase subunit F [Xanthomonas translucens]|uniref:alkyl hydroperoxide reductase subunit F n=1 Tax=Xanthomonas campestris pv. translucens TaxID=343 RepID=UPI0002A7B2AB|nr:alkyl hydroperoxide reductase subunit F [Xanthomonas translucens]AKK66629.1 alkyl hydroperoxide reductase [Xanthomonas translucens pv. undulosa]AVY65483.1 alkyl hydroperoxide reductase [Xanthomonas translucens pv. undulosa]ELP97338.1 alkyl hydroperoxide reductase subunit F [Xanthomonas translucens DAR61454]MBC3971962.1 alkyl hydroperoxide reductase subunit F [Xanthomonas translucens pv. undulosa]MCT8270592.1 alkyl hydroperoxide reductase subunit F [Xanthomonas translucens pv. undulosa]
MLDADLKTQLKAYLERVVRPIHITASVDDGAKSREMLDLLEDLVLLSDQISLDVHRDSAERTPSFALSSPGHDIHLRFAGLPLGHEFTSLVLALLQVGGHPSKATAEVIEQVRNLPGDYVFETYFSLSCQNCPDVVQALNLAAVLNPNIKHVAIDGALFQDEVEARQIMSVPTVYLNGDVFDQGRMSLEQIVAKLDTGAAKRDAANIAAKAPFDVLVIGGGPAGAAAAIYAARKGIRTGVAAERFGGQVLDTMAIENFISVQETEGPKMAAALEQHVRQYDVDIMNLQRAEQLIPAGADGLVEIKLANGASLKSRSVILSTGARWRQMNVPGEDQYRNKGVAYCPHCDGPLFKGKRVAVIGGGNSGVEAAIDLAGIVSHVTLVEFDAKLRADEVLQRKLRSLGNVDIIVNAQSTEVIGDGSKVTGLVYKDRVGGDVHRLALEGIFVQIGLLPNTEWLQGTVALSPRGEIVVDDRGQTSLPGVFAAGDATTVPYKQIIIAMGEGSKAALSAFDHLIRSSAPVSSAVAEAA